MVADRKLYDVLGVEPNASETEIKRAFKLSALKHHPDKNGNDPKSSELFKEATDAYDVLSDPQKRAAYDQFGMSRPQDHHHHPGHVDLSDIFGSMFGNMFSGGGGGGGVRHEQRTQNKRIDAVQVVVSLVDVFQGTIKSVSIELPDKCEACQGQGVPDPANDIIQCLKCGGSGVVINQMGPFIAQSPCGSCFGRGKLVRPGRACADCGGNKVKPTKRTFDVRLPKGLPNGHTHTIKDKGSFSTDDMNHADVRLMFTYALPSKDDRVLVDRIENADVHMKLFVTLAELLCGFEVVVASWGKPIRIRSSAYFDPKETFRFVGAGMPRYKKDGEFGDLIVTVEVTFPTGREFAKYAPVFSKALRLGGDSPPPPPPQQGDPPSVDELELEIS